MVDVCMPCVAAVLWARAHDSVERKRRRRPRDLSRWMSPTRAMATSSLLRLALACLAARSGAALRLGAAAAAARAPECRASPPRMGDETKRCALISVSAEDPLRLAKVLKKAWMEGGVKRGLVGSVLVGNDSVQIAASGPVALATSVEMA